MAFWLLKTEPDEFSWTDQRQRGASGEIWTGVRNHQARQALEAMQIGDRAMFYHTGKERSLVGTVTIVEQAFPDPTDPAWRAVRVVAATEFRQPLSLAAIRQAGLPSLDGLVLLKNPRLSVQSVTEAEWDVLLDLAGGEVPVAGE